MQSIHESTPLCSALTQVWTNIAIQLILEPGQKHVSEDPFHLSWETSRSTVEKTETCHKGCVKLMSSSLASQTFLTSLARNLCRSKQFGSGCACIGWPSRQTARQTALHIFQPFWLFLPRVHRDQESWNWVKQRFAWAQAHTNTLARQSIRTKWNI